MRKIISQAVILILTAAAFTAAVYYISRYSVSESHTFYCLSFKSSLVTGIILGIMSVLTIKFLLYFFGDGRYSRSKIGKVDQMDGKQFEDFLRTRFEKRGYKVELTPSSGDYGADLICKNRDGILVVQAKRYEKHVGVEAIQEVVAARDYYTADRCMVVTNSYYTKNAILLADANDVELYDRDNIFEL